MFFLRVNYAFLEFILLFQASQCFAENAAQNVVTTRESCLSFLLSEALNTIEIPTVFTPAVYEDGKRISFEILKDFPPSQFFYVGIGRSPLLFATIISLLYPQQTIFLPLSRFRTEEPLSPEDTMALEHHLELFLPDENTLEGKNILLIDYVSKGKSLSNAKKIVAEHITPRVRVFTAAIITGQYANDVMKRTGFLPDHIYNIQNNSLHMMLTYSMFKKWSPYGGFRPPFQPLVPNPEYSSFRSTIKQLMENDGMLLK